MIPTPAQVNNDTSPASTTPDARFTPLLNDPIFAALHNAFLLGWNLMELKSRVQLTACNLSLDSLTYDQSTSRFTANIFQLAPPPADGASLEQPSVIDAVLKNIVLKDVATPNSIENGSKPTTTTAQSLSTELRDNAWLTSVFRAIFQQIVMLHLQRFPDSDTTYTIYDLVVPPEDQPTYPYLYPSGGKLMDCATIGISSIHDPHKANETIDTFVVQFKLYDVTRRALNCLTLLLDDAKESLIPATIATYQRLLVQDILGIATDPTPDNIKAAIKQLSNLIIRFLEAWDSFLRESFYVNPSSQRLGIPVALASNGTDLAADNEIELAAYEAGRSMAALSWNVTVAIVPLESALTLTTEQLKDPKLRECLAQKVQSVWLNVFNDRDVNHVQYQIAALGTALDTAYYRVNRAMKTPSADDPAAPLNPDLPSQAIQAVKQSLDYWQRTVALLCSPDGGIRLNPVSATAPPSDVDEASPPQAQRPSRHWLLLFFAGLKGGSSHPPVKAVPRPSKPLDWDMAKTLRMELIQQAVVWQSLLLCQQSLQMYTLETVTQRILNDFMQDLEKTVKGELRKYALGRWVSIGIALLIFVLILGLVILGLASNRFQPNTLLGSPLVIITAIGALLAPFVTSISSWLSKLGSFFGAAGTSLEQALQDGYDRLLREFDDLNHNVSITFPLIEFFLWNEAIEFDGEPIKDGYDFLVNVFWTGSDREAEFERVARAAFGPISAIISAQLHSKSTQRGNSTRKPS